jgi:hypothetical protein
MKAVFTFVFAALCLAAGPAAAKADIPPELAQAPMAMTHLGSIICS